MKTITLPEIAIGKYFSKEEGQHYEVRKRCAMYYMAQVNDSLPQETGTTLKAVSIEDLATWIEDYRESQTCEYTMISKELGKEITVETKYLLRNGDIFSIVGKGKTINQALTRMVAVISLIYAEYTTAYFHSVTILSPFIDRVVRFMGTVDYVDQLPKVFFEQNEVKCYIVKYSGTSKEPGKERIDKEYFNCNQQWLTYDENANEFL